MGDTKTSHIDADTRTEVFVKTARESREPQAVVVANIGGSTALVTIEWFRFIENDTFQIAHLRPIETGDSREANLRTIQMRENDQLFVTADQPVDVFVYCEEPGERVKY